MKKLLSATLAAGMLLGSVVMMPSAEAKRCWYDQHGRTHCDNGKHRGHYKRYTRDGRYFYDDRRGSWFDSRTGKIVKGSLIGAGIGAGTGYILDKPLGKSTVLGAIVGAGVQAVRQMD